MKAIVRDRYGDHSAIQVAEIDTPTAAAGEVLVDVSAASIGQDIWHILTGLPLLSRLAFGLRRPRSHRLGNDFAGVIRAVGTGVDRFAVGDRVVGTVRGAFADTLAVPANRLVALPDTVDEREASCLPVSGCTALAALASAGLDGPDATGITVAVIGAAGGVGHIALQVAAHRGATVTAVCRGAAADLMTNLGAADCIDYTATDLVATGRRWDVIIDTAGRRPVGRLRKVLSPRGTIVVVGGEGGGRLLGGFGREQLSRPAARLAGQRVRGLFSTESTEGISTLVGLMADGHLMPAIDTVLPMHAAADGIVRLRGGRLQGKVVLVTR
ncbi:NAD(P)-dependent alcohol dehydrogenase [Williamsia sp. CHRR-6]|uniref:NAD(P)-dependent alcohol dehydrogenase n=1 Tax=Williamsia sp. CHRR-6 TaxID=2835871 RepID=UPI001BD944EA|nr:NAD(P)-dependent alcohol dehydrogenase [Williamsia sp. CHRR-6]MBT0568530.1 NAD(P)-dependent alcohol dehydrogenase [Williamsia sp. CHRR-6]